jgi:SAM-dependent methyltransferase
MTDRERNNFYNKELKKYCKDTVVLDVGAGLGLLSLMACRAGAKKVYAVEVNPLAIAALKKLKEDENLLQLEIIQAASWDINLPEQVDIIVHEIFGPFLLDEMCLYTLNDVKKHLKPGGRLIPEKFGFDFKFFDTETIESINYISGLSQSYDGLMQGQQTIIEDFVNDDGQNWVNVGTWGFYDYPMTRIDTGFSFRKPTRIDALWCKPYIISGDERLNLNKTSINRHWGNAFLRFGKFAIMEEGVDLRISFQIDENLMSFQTGIDLPVGG